MDKSYFDVVIDRGKDSNTYSTKWSGIANRFSGYSDEGVLPMWVADMDFRCPPEVIEAVQKRALHGIYGYTDKSLVLKFIDAAADWVERRHGWKFDPAWCFYCPGVVPMLNAAVQEFTEPGDGVIIQSPVYYPFADGPINNGRVLKRNNLIEKSKGYYVMDYDNLAELASDPKTKLLILCSPHNPVGRVWSEEELRKLCEICLENNVIVVSDEIHADLVMPGHKHIPTGSLGEDILNNLISCYAPSKTFNIAGLRAAVGVSANREYRERMQKRLLANRLPNSNVFGPLAGEAAYRFGDSYADTLVSYVHDNMEYVKTFCEENMPEISAPVSEGTYMIWLDLRNLNLGKDGTNDFMMKNCKIAGDFGTWFGDIGSGFVRLNLGCPRATVEEAMRRIKAAYDELKA